MAMLPVDRELLRQIKIEKIQKKIQEVESQMNERAHLLNRLEQLNEIEKLRSERIVDRVAKGRPHFKINQEMDRLKIDEARSYSISPLPPAVLSDLLSHRTKEFTNKQLETANQIRYLAVERQRLQDARQRLKEKRNNVLYAPSPVGKETEKAWGYKYDIYTPLEYSPLTNSLSPRYCECCNPFLPEVTWATGRPYRFKPRKVCRDKHGCYVPRRLYQSGLWY